MALLRLLRARDYDFVTPTPLTHARVLARAEKAQARDLRDVFGWNAPFAPQTVGAEIFDLLARADALEARGALYASRHRVARCGDLLFLHSAFPTLARDCVFFGPDSYRFAEFLKRALQGREHAARIVDIGAGSGVGALMAGQVCANARLTLTDVNPLALRLARINAAAAGREVELIEASALDGVIGPMDVIVANPPYIMDASRRAYRDGGDMHGARVSLDWAQASAARLAPGGALLLYTGSAIINGADPLREALRDLAENQNCTLRYEEIDPDVWSEELQREEYADAERIAVVGAIMVKA